MQRIRCYHVSIIFFAKASTRAACANANQNCDIDQGQGGGMAVEDGAALGALFSNLYSKKEIPDRLKLFQDLRLDRVSALQVISSVGQDQVAQTHDQVRPFIKGPLPSESISNRTLLVHWALRTLLAGTPEDCHAHNFTPNIIRDALELLQEYQAGQSTLRR